MSDSEVESGEYSEEEEEEDEELESSSSETRRVRAQFSDPPRRSGRAGAKSTSAKLASKASAPPKARGRPRAVQIEYDSNEEDEEDDEDARPRKGRLPRQNPSRNRKQVKRGATEKELQELLGDDEDEDDMEEDGGKRDNRSKRKIQEDDEEVDLDDLSVFSKLGGAGGERRAEALLDRREENGERQYFVKWQGRSYLHCSWASEKELLAVKGGKMRLQKFDKRFDSGLIVKGEADEVFPADYLEVDRIIEGRTNGKDVEYLVKWQALGYDCCTWEKASDVNDDQALQRFKRWSANPGVAKFAKKERPAPNKWVKLSKSPEYENGNLLREYQLESLNWLTFNWYHKRNTILADEMGLGKTVQAMSILHHLYTNECVLGPFLVVAPLSTIPHWKREFEGWTKMNAIVYHGSAAAREVIRKCELYHRDPSTNKVILGAPKFNVLITTYEMVLSDSKTLKPFQWRYLVVDEAHRLKNQDSKLIGELRNYRYDHVLLMTGTPLQNNTTELWSLLNFLNPDKFGSLSDFLMHYGDLTTATQVDKLHALLRPIMLRRLKEDVEKSIMPLEETIVEVELTNLQKRYYRAIYERNFAYLTQGRKGGNVPSLLNVVMQLRKSKSRACNHPFLLNGVEDQINKEESCLTFDDKMRTLIRASGKLVLIDKLLPRLKEQGHKVLIFSQFVKVLDILQDYLDFRHYEFERIDGGVRGNDRQAAIDRFSREGSTKFVFLLCTRAGGVGINLTAADTVIIFDSDWNPQNDVQAQARCHRIGQKQMVKVYRLITRNTYEKDMFVRASKKLGLDQAVLNKIEGVKAEQANAKERDFGPSSMKKDEIDSLLKHGAYDVFREGKDKPDVEYDEADIERILERDSTKITYSGPKQDALASLSKASFVSGAADNQIDMEDPDFWKKLLPSAAQSMVDPNILEGSRNRKSVKRFDLPDDLLGEDDDEGGPVSEDEEYRSRANFKEVPGVVIDHSQDWSLSSRARFRAALLAFGFGRWEAIREMGKLKPTVEQIQAYAEAMIEQMCKAVGDQDPVGRFQIIDNSGSGVKYTPLVPPVSGDQPADPDAAPGPRSISYRNHWTLHGENWDSYVARNAAIVLQKLMLVAIVGNHVRKYGAEFSKLPILKVPPLSATPISWWGDTMDNYLVLGMFRHGVGRYSEMWADPELAFPNKPLAPGESPSSRPEDVGTGGWEGLGQLFLNERSRRLQKAILSKMPRSERALLREKKKTRRSAASTVANEATPTEGGGSQRIAARRGQLETDWSKREKADFYRTLSSWGVAVNAPPPGQGPNDPDGSKIDWTYIIKEATLYKTPAVIEQYYRTMIHFCELTLQDSMLEKCLYVQPMAVDGVVSTEPVIDPEVAEQREAVKELLPKDVELSSKQVSRLMQRLRLFNKLRVYVISKGESAVRSYFLSLKRKTGKGYPKWWNNDHDVAVVMATNKHGFFWEDMLKDPEFPFLEIWRSLGGSEEAEAADVAAKSAAKKERKKLMHEQSQVGTSPGGMLEDDVGDDGDDGQGGAAGAGAAGGDASGKKKRSRTMAGDKQVRRDRGRRCALVDWPKDAVLLKRIEACLDDIAADDLWYETEGIVGDGLRRVPVPAKKELAPESPPQAAPILADGDYQDGADDGGFNARRRRSGGSKATKRAAPARVKVFRVPAGVQYDSTGKVIFPLVLSKSASILSLGEVVADRPGFHSEKYVWPAGFKSTRLYTSIKQGSKKIWYTCEIVDDGSANPLFQISCEDLEEPVVMPTPSSAWTEVINRANLFRSRPEGDSNVKMLAQVSGPEYFGFSQPFVASLIQNLPGVELLENFRREDFGSRVTKTKKPSKKKPKKQMEEEIDPIEEDAWKNDVVQKVEADDQEQQKKRPREDGDVVEEEEGEDVEEPFVKEPKVEAS